MSGDEGALFIFGEHMARGEKLSAKRLDFLDGGGEMGGLIRAKDWTGTPLGPPEKWPAELRTVVRLMLTTNHPIFIFWGDELTCLYNDAFSRSLGPEKHPDALGAPGCQVWDEIWDIIGSQIDYVMSGQGATWHENHLVPIIRHGRREDVYWTYSYSPIDNPHAETGVGGILVICTETTNLVKAEKEKEHEAREAKTRIQEIHHRVKNNIATITAIVNLEARKLDNPALVHPFHRISGRLKSFSKLYEMMLCMEGQDHLDAGLYIQDLCEAISDMSADAHDSNIRCSTEVESHGMSSEHAFHLGAVVVELMSNAYTHAFVGQSSGDIHVRLKKGEDLLTLTIADTGQGITVPCNKDTRSTGIGMKLVQHYAETLHAEFRQETGKKGTTSILAIPIAKLTSE